MPQLTESDTHAKPKRTPGLVPLQSEMYGSMAEAMLSSDAPSESEVLASRDGRPRRREGEVPRPRGNEFYEESRYFYIPPKEPAVPHCSACVKCSAIKPALATLKCYTCTKYDPNRRGFYCQGCFDARHPWHRQPHTWLPMSSAEDLDEASKGQRVRAEFDHRVAGVQGLLKEVRRRGRSARRRRRTPAAAALPYRRRLSRRLPLSPTPCRRRR